MHPVLTGTGFGLKNGRKSIMNRRELIDYCLTYPDAFEDYPFDDGPNIAGAWTVMRHIEQKGFAFILARRPLRNINASRNAAIFCARFIPASNRLTI
jgi:hypothetical protein